MRQPRPLKKACPHYDAHKHTPAHPRTTFFSTGPRKADRVWCLRCGNDSHATSNCSENSAPVLFPQTDDLKQALEGTCTWCGIKGHTLKECMRRAPIQADENKKDITALNAKISAMDKAFAAALEVTEKVTDLQLQMDGLLSWKGKTDTMMSQQGDRLKALEDWKSSNEAVISQAATTSRFDAFVSSQFAEVERLANSALPRHTFDDYVKSLQPHARSGEKEKDKDVHMRSTSMGKRQQRDVIEVDRDHGSPADAAKSGHGTDPPRPTTETSSSSASASRAASRGASAFGQIPAPPGASPGPWWLRLPPHESDVWDPDCLDCLFSEWNSDKDIRFQGWVAEHATEEMTITARSLATGPLTPDKREGITAVLKATRMSPVVFTNMRQD